MEARLLLFVLAALGAACSAPEQPRQLGAIAPPGSAFPHLASTTDHRPVLSWVETNPAQSALRFSVLGTDMRWQEAITVAQGEGWFLNWADFPSVVPIDERLWAAHWLVSRGSFAYDIAISTSRDAGRSWSAAITPHTDATLTEHGFVSLFPWQGAIGAIWLDGRNMAAAGGMHEAGGAMTLRSALVGPEGDLRESQLVDPRVCDCCQTDATATTEGPIAAYRNRTATEIRDVHVARARANDWLDDELLHADNWTVSGCPVNGPAIDATDSLVGVAWFTAAQEVGAIRYARSIDGGLTFSAPTDVATEQPLGRVDLALLADGSAAVSWLRSTAATGEAEIVVRRIEPSGRMGRAQIAARTSAERASGFPQMVRAGDALVLAWTDVSGGTSQVRTASIAVDSL